METCTPEASASTDPALPNGEPSGCAAEALSLGAPARTAPAEDRPGDDAPMRKVWEAAVDAVVPEGRENAISWAVVVERVQARIAVYLPDRVFKPETVLRRCQEAAARLRRMKPPVNVIGLSECGVFKGNDEDVLQRSAQQWRRARTQIEEACVYDRVNGPRILAALGQLGLPAESERAA